MISILLVDDHEMLLDGVALALDSLPDIEVVATATSRATAYQRFVALEPDVVVVDYRIGAETGADLARDVIRRDPDASVLAISALRADYVLDDVIDAGCVGFVDKRRGIDELATAVRAVGGGSAHFPPHVVGNRSLPGSADSLELTTREREILELLGQGKHTVDIATDLRVSVHTVRNHTREIRRKLGVQTQLAAVIEGMRLGLIPSPTPG